MKCPRCNTNNIDESATICPNCGYTLSSESNQDISAIDEDTLDFVITEKSEDDREFVGGSKEFTNDSDPIGDDPQQLKTNEISNELNSDSLTLDTEIASIDKLDDDSEPLLPLNSDMIETEDPTSIISSSSPDTSDSPSDKLQKLSDEEVKKIEQNLYGKGPILNDREKAEIIMKKDDTDEPNNKIKFQSDDSLKTSPLTDQLKGEDIPRPKMTERRRGTAFFFRNYIQILGSQELHSSDELYVNSRVYELKAKQINPRLIFGSAAVVLVLLLVGVGSLFISDISNDSGQLVGIVLNEEGQPVLQSVKIRFPELGITTTSDAKGLFSCEGLPRGTHQIEFLWGGIVQWTDFATIADGKTTTIAFQPESSNLVIEQTTVEPEKTKELATNQAQESSVSIDVNNQTKKKTSAKPQTKKKSTEAKSSRYSKLSLQANIEGARLMMDGTVVGAGNLTYDRLKAGKHSYTVSKEGYNPVSGQITLKKGKTSQLAIDLTPIAENTKQKTFSAEDYYYSGTTAYENGEFDIAISDLTKAIDLDPNYSQAYMDRGEIYAQLKDNKSAHDDFVRVAEIKRFKKAYSASVTAYNRAIDVNRKSITAYLGRASAHLAKGDNRAAVIDYEIVLRMDKRNSEAYFGLGKARFSQGSYKKAIKHFKDARSIDSHNPLTHQYLMLSYLALDDTKNVRKSYEKFAKIASEEEISKLHSDSRFAAVVRIVERNK
ncbi:MAG: hypothetical protein DRP47_07880 [Candidatus Zixiibacteriota bacterium]|nr:MAG: hypothetical protein DRP47_07880 [candidate division Zixibacteria bacterium]